MYYDDQIAGLAAMCARSRRGSSAWPPSPTRPRTRCSTDFEGRFPPPRSTWYRSARDATVTTTS